jgi:diguanylate cyclase (GGDEF)-like protein
MKRLPVTARLVIAFILVTLIIGGGSYIFLISVTQDAYTSLQIEKLLTSQDQYQATNAKGLEDMGVSPSELRTFLDSALARHGFVVNGNQLILVQRENEVLSYKSSPIGWLNWSNHTVYTFLGFLGVLLIISVSIQYGVMRTALQPLIQLRKTTEDILAGKFEVRIRYNAADELGRTFQALKTLCHELERRDEALEKVSELATKDGLTGLKNHRAFKEELKRQLAMARRDKTSMGLIILDVDHFKKFNDTWGHQAGDEVLKAVANVIQSAVRVSDFVARYGGEEFVVLLPSTPLEGVQAVGEKLRISLEEKKVPLTTHPGESVTVTASFGGLSIEAEKLAWSEEALDHTQYVEECDKNLYAAKKAGRNRVIASQYSGAGDA